MRLFPHTIRQRILWFSILTGISVIAWIFLTLSIQSIRIIKLSEYTSFLSLFFLYVSLLISPVYALFPELPWKERCVRARRAIGVSGWGFGLLHGVVAFFGQSGGVAGIAFLSQRYLVAVILGCIALLILSLMALTSSDFAVQKLGFLRWKLLHRMMYVATLCIVIHSFLLGTHFRFLSNSIPQIFFVSLCILGLLEMYRLGKFILRFSPTFRLRIGLMLSIFLVSLQVTRFLQKQENNLSVHPTHESGNAVTHGLSIEYKLVTDTPAIVEAGKEVPLTLQVLDWSTRLPIENFTETHGEIMKLVISTDRLDWFMHHSPRLQMNTFHDTITFPTADTYYLIATVKPKEKLPVTVSTVLKVVGDEKIAVEKSNPVQIIMTSPTKLSVQEFASDSGQIRFRVEEKKSRKPVALEEYFGSLGQLVLINTTTLESKNLYPTITREWYATLKPGDAQVPFAVEPGSSIFTPGLYKIFAEFKVADQVYSKYFTLELTAYEK